MEEEAKQPTNPQPGPQVTPSTISSEPLRGTSKKNTKPIIITVVIIFILVIVGGGGYFFFFRGSGEEEALPTPTPALGVSVSTSTPVPTPTPEPIDKSKISIQVLNGTGIAKEASFLQGKLKDAGWTKVSLGNSDKQDYTKAQVSFGSSVPSSAKDEVLKLLKDFYQGANEVKDTKLDKNSIRITTGLQKGATPKPSATPAPKTPAPTTSPTVTPQASPSPSPSPSPAT